MAFTVRVIEKAPYILNAAEIINEHWATEKHQQFLRQELAAQERMHSWTLATKERMQGRALRTEKAMRNDMIKERGYQAHLDALTQKHSSNRQRTSSRTSTHD